MTRRRTWSSRRGRAKCPRDRDIACDGVGISERGHGPPRDGRESGPLRPARRPLTTRVYPGRASLAATLERIDALQVASTLRDTGRMTPGACQHTYSSPAPAAVSSGDQNPHTLSPAAPPHTPHPPARRGRSPRPPRPRRPPAPPTPPAAPGTVVGRRAARRTLCSADCAVGSGEWAEPPHSPWTLHWTPQKKGIFCPFRGVPGNPPARVRGGHQDPPGGPSPRGPLAAGGGFSPWTGDTPRSPRPRPSADPSRVPRCWASRGSGMSRPRSRTSSLTESRRPSGARDGRPVRLGATAIDTLVSRRRQRLPPSPEGACRNFTRSA